MILFALLGIAATLIRLPERSWDAVNIVGLAGGAALLGLFVFWNSRRETPLVPGGMFTTQVTGANIATLLIYFVFSGAIFILSFLLQQYVGMRPPIAGLAVLPVTLVIALLSGPSGRITDRFGPRGQMIAGPTLVAAASAWFLWRAGGGDYLADYLPGILMQGVGIVLIIPSITTSALHVLPRYSGTASGVNNALARIAGLLAIAAVGSALGFGFSSTLDARLAEEDISPAQRSAVLEEADQLLNLELPVGLTPEQRLRIEAYARESFIAGTRMAFSITLILSTITIFVTALTIPRRPPTLSVGDDGS
jgi:MFS family permease